MQLEVINNKSIDELKTALVESNGIKSTVGGRLMSALVDLEYAFNSYKSRLDDAVHELQREGQNMVTGYISRPWLSATEQLPSKLNDVEVAKDKVLLLIDLMTAE